MHCSSAKPWTKFAFSKEVILQRQSNVAARSQISSRRWLVPYISKGSTSKLASRRTKLKVWMSVYLITLRSRWRVCAPPLHSDAIIADSDIDKFYAFTEPLIRSVFSDNMTAELPLDLSQDEEFVIGHFHTSTLILGRSGTGKTTCLIYKLVAQYLAGRVLKAGRPRRQVCEPKDQTLHLSDIISATYPGPYHSLHLSRR